MYSPLTISTALSTLHAAGAAGLTQQVAIPGKVAVVIASVHLNGEAAGADSQFQLEGFILNHAGNNADDDAGDSRVLWWDDCGKTGTPKAAPSVASGAGGAVQKDMVWVAKGNGRGCITAEGIELKLRADGGLDAWNAAATDLVEVQIRMIPGQAIGSGI